MAAAALKKAAGTKKLAGGPKRETTKPESQPIEDGTTSSKGRKRKEDDDNIENDKPVPKRARMTKAPAPKTKPTINKLPSERLNVYVFGEGSNAELGLGPDKTSIDVKRPRLNPKLKASDVGVVALACGGMHSLAITHTGELLSWGVNDNGALGRDTKWDGGLRDVDDSSGSDSEDDDSGLNPYESTPAPIDTFPPDTKIVKVAAGDSISLALSSEGNVFGWGCFRNQNGIMGFYSSTASRQRVAPSRSRDKNDDSVFVQYKPFLYPELSKIVSIACGSNHAMALSQSGEVYVWGCGEQNQLGHHINERHDVEGKASLVPSLLRTGRRKYKAIFSGNDHAFAIDTKDQVWAWGLNSFGQTGIAGDAGGNGSSVFVPTFVKSLSNPSDPVTQLCGGQHHSLALTKSGKCLAFGRLDGLQLGLDISQLPDDVLIYDEHVPPRPRILIEPTPIPKIGKIAYAAAGVDHSIVINEEGHAYSWGISVTYQTGQGKTEDVEYPTQIENTAVRDKKLTWVGCGGQFSIVAGPAELPQVNGARHVNGDVEMGGA